LIIVFLYTTSGQQSSVVCCHNDILSCSTSGLLNISGVSGIINVMSLVRIAAGCLLILNSLEAIMKT